MPYFNNPDKFFISNFNVTVLQDLNNQIRDYLIGMQPFSENKRVILDKHTAVTFAKIKTIHAGIKSQNIFAKSVDDNTFKLLQEKYKQDNKDLIDINTKSIEKDNKKNQDSKKTNEENIKKVIAENEKSISEITQLNTAKKEKFIELINALFSAENKNFVLTDNSTIEGRYTFPKSKIQNENTIMPKLPFPTFGEDKAIDNSNYASDYINQGANVAFKVKDSEGNLIDLTTHQGAKIFTGWGIKSKNGYIPDPTKTYSPAMPSSVVDKPLFDAFYSNKLEAPPGAVKFFIEKLHGSYTDFSPFKMNKVSSSNANGFNENLSNRAVFASYIETFNDNYSVNANDENLLGHAESYPVYNSTKRSVTLTFSIISDYSLEMLLSLQKIYNELSIDNDLQSKIEQVRKLTYYDKGLGFTGTPFGIGDAGYQSVFSDTPETLWKKITFLAQCCYPYYRNDGKMKEQPMVRIRLGDWYDLTGMIKSLAIDTDTYDSRMDLNPSSIGVIPFAIKVTLNIDVYHNSEPSSTFWGFYHRLEFDNGTANKDTGKGLFKEKDSKGFGNVNSRMEDKEIEPKTTSEITKREWQPIEKIAMNEIELFKTEYEKVLLNPIDIPKTKQQAEIKNSLSTLDRINKLSDKLRDLYGYTKKSGSQILNEVVNNIGGKELGELREYKDGIEKIYGGVNANLNNVADIAKTGDKALKKIGIDVNASESVNNVVESINNVKMSNIIPKTFGDIIGYVKPKK